MKKTEKINYKLMVIIELMILAVLLAVDAYGYYHYVPNVKKTITLATSVKPETFTELYFENNLKLPTDVVIGRKYSFAFTVHNLENKTYKYPYEVYINNNGQRYSIQKGVFSLKQDQSRTIEEDFSVISLATRSAVTVNLIDKNQQIDFWIERQSSNI